MRTLAKHLKAYLLYCVLGPLFKLLEVVFELYVPLVVKDLIENGIKYSDITYIEISALKIVLLGLLGFLSALSAQLFAAKASTHAVGDLKKDLFSHIQKLSFNQLESIGQSTLYSRLTSDMNQIQTGVNLALRLLLRSPFVVFGAMVMAFTVNVKSAVYFVIVIPILFAFTFAILLITIPMFSNQQKALDGIVNTSRENLNGTRVIRAFRHEQEEVKEFALKTGSLSHLQKISSSISAILNPFTTILVNLFILCLIHNGYMQFNSGTITQGEVLALYNYMSMILVELIKLSNLIITITKAISSANRVEQILDIVPEDIPSVVLASHTCTQDNSIVFEDVNYHYPDSTVSIIENISFNLKPGESLGVIGGIGSGKSTLGHLIAGYYTPSKGKVLINGNDPCLCDPNTIRDHVGYVFQRASLSSGTVRSNLLWGNPKATDSDMKDALTIAQAWTYVEEKTGLDTIVERDGKNFSGGQRQRLCIARALIKKPSILILDDSSSALDYITEAKLRISLSALPWKPTIIIISQRISSIQHCDHILVLDKGKNAGYGTHEELIKNSNEYRDIAISQGMEVIA